MASIDWDNGKTRRETFKFFDLVRLILEIWRVMSNWLNWLNCSGGHKAKVIETNSYYIWRPSQIYDGNPTSVRCPLSEQRSRLNLWNTNASIRCVINYSDVIMGAMASQITSLTIVYSAVYSDPNHRKHQSTASLASVRGIHRWPVNSPHKWPVTRKMFLFDDVIMVSVLGNTLSLYLHERST